MSPWAAVVAVYEHLLITHKTWIDKWVVEAEHRLRVVTNIQKFANIHSCKLIFLVENDYPEYAVWNIAVREYSACDILLDFFGSADVAIDLYLS